MTHIIYKIIYSQLLTEVTVNVATNFDFVTFFREQRSHSEVGIEIYSEKEIKTNK